MNKTGQIIPGLKSSQLGLIPFDWEIRQLGELIHLLSGLHLDPSEYNKVENGIPYFTGPTDYTNDITQITKWSTKTSAIAIYGDLLLTVKGSGVGSLHQLLLNKVSIGRQIMALRPKNNSCIEFISYSLVACEYQFQQLAKGNMIPGLTRADILTIKIKTPPLFEQTAIANLLGTWDKSIQTITKLIAQKEQCKKWLMLQLLTGRKRLEGFNERWKESRLVDVFTERNEIGHPNLPLLSVGASGIYPQSNSIKKDTSNVDKSKYRRICPGDIGYNTMRMWQGRSALSELEGIVSPAYTIVTPKENADSIFFSYLFKTEVLINHFWRNSQGLVDDTLNCKWKDFSIVKIEIPPTKEEQTSISKVLKKADNEILLLKAKAEQLVELKKGLMQVLLTGKKRIKMS